MKLFGYITIQKELNILQKKKLSSNATKAQDQKADQEKDGLKGYLIHWVT
jgi:hypothetical protein